MDYDEEVEKTQRRVSLEQEQLELLSKLSQVRKSLAELAPKKLGRPKSTSQHVAEDGTFEAKRSRGRPKKDPSNAEQPKPKRLGLPSLLMNIIESNGRSMKNDELVDAACDAGYKSNSADFENIVYQCLSKLVRDGSLTKVNAGKNAEYSIAAA
jgi:hypothetical protein